MEIGTKSINSPEYRINSNPRSKITLPFLILSIATIIVYISGLGHQLNSNYIKISEYEIWRLFTTIFASTNIVFVILNLLWLRALSNVSETRRGSIAFVMDIFFKSLLINSFSIVIFVVLVTLARYVGWIFTYMVYAQQDWVYSGYGVLLLSEISYIFITDNQRRKDNDARNTISNIRRLQILYVLLSIIYFPYSQAFSAGALAFLRSRGVFGCVERFEKSLWNFTIEQKLRKFDSLFYFYFEKTDEEEKFAYDDKEQNTIVGDAEDDHAEIANERLVQVIIVPETSVEIKTETETVKVKNMTVEDSEKKHQQVDISDDEIDGNTRKVDINNLDSFEI